VLSLHSWKTICRRCTAALLLEAVLVPVVPASDTDDSQQPAEHAEEASDNDAEDQRATQRLDFAIDFYQSEDGSIRRGGLNYTWAPLANHSFAATLPLVNSSLASVEGSGIGDLLLRYNWVPAMTLTADPWVPNSLGIGLGLLVPTGNAAEGTGGDQWVLVPSFGFVAKLGKRTTLLPQLQYTKSIAEGELAQGMQTIALSADLVHVALSKFWVQYTPTVSYDLEAEQYEFDNLIVLGQQFTRRIALRLELQTLNVADPQDPAGDGRELDFRATLKLQWILAY